MYPHERSLVKKLVDRPFVLLGVNSDDNRDEIKKIMHKDQLTWRSWWDGGSTDGPIQTAYNVSHWPTIYLLDHEGVIRDIDLRGPRLEEAIERLLAEVKKQKKGK
jgi:hypothetical protein